jgi:thiamine-monophosphate kinase
MNEFSLINKLRGSLATNDSVRVGCGDDCAILKIPTGSHELLFKTDAVVEGIHFEKTTHPEQVGHKALARCLSDIAAMAGTPQAALITIGLPPDYDMAFVEGIYSGLNRLAKRHGVAVAGGETTTNPERIFISVAAIGWVPTGKAILRSGAKPGEALFVTGELGGSIKAKHLEFEPRLEEARWLSENFKISAMIDISDGLAGDLRHVCEESKVGAELFGPAIPIARAARVAARESSSAKPALVAALTDGEDFELLFTLSSRKAVSLVDAWKKQFPRLKLSCIGRATDGKEILLRDKNGTRRLSAHGYEHFK